MPSYRLLRIGAAPDFEGRWDGPFWRHAPALAVDHFHPRSTGHRPRTEAKLLHDGQALNVLFRVDDRYVRAVHTEFESDTYKDSCVELFVQPQGRTGYFALEINCSGAFSLRYIEDWTRTPNRFAKWTAVSPADASRVRVAHAMPEVVEPERTEPVTWWVELSLPSGVMEPYCGPIGPLSGQSWRGNLFKCGDETSHPHWASWAPIGEELNFHQPVHFGELEFE
jgi:hypothetical protein